LLHLQIKLRRIDDGLVLRGKLSGECI